MKVGFIGLGRMGMPMAKNVLRSGFELTVHNRSRAKVEEMAGLGAIPALSAGEVTQEADIVLTCLPDVPTVEQIFLGEDGIVAHAKPGQVLVDHSTIGPSYARNISEAATIKGASFLDGPITGGSVDVAEAAALNILIGGEKAAFDKALPVLNAMGQNIIHLGPSGAGSAMKLVNILMVGINSLGAAEAFLLAVRYGVDPQSFLEIVDRSAGNSWMFSFIGSRMLNRDFRGDRVPLRLTAKDMGLVYEMAQVAGVPVRAGFEALKIFQEAEAKGLGENDISAILTMLEDLADNPSVDR